MYVPISWNIEFCDPSGEYISLYTNYGMFIGLLAGLSTDKSIGQGEQYITVHINHVSCSVLGWNQRLEFRDCAGLNAGGIPVSNNSRLKDRATFKPKIMGGRSHSPSPPSPFPYPFTLSPSSLPFSSCPLPLPSLVLPSSPLPSRPLPCPLRSRPLKSS